MVDKKIMAPHQFIKKQTRYRRERSKQLGEG
jgi:hypothetical protein